MSIKRSLGPNYFRLFIKYVLSMIFSFAGVSYVSAQDTTKVPAADTSLPFPIHDRRGDFISANPSVYDFQLPSNIKDSVAYDPQTNTYTVYEKIGNKYYRTPTVYTAEEFRAMEARRSEMKYFQKRANTLSILNRGSVKPKLNIYDNLFNRLFGNGKIEIERFRQKTQSS